MRTVTLTIYEYDELPTDKAKEAARDWMLQALREAPDDSDYRKVLTTLQELPMDRLLKAIETLDHCKLTGFYADHDALLAVREHLEKHPDAELSDLHRAATRAIEKLWDEEQNSWSETDYLEDMIRGNDYEFEENGKRSTHPKA